MSSVQALSSYAGKNSSALVRFSDGTGTYLVFIPNSGTPPTVAGVFLAITKFLSGSQAYGAGQAAADFISAINPVVRTRLVSTAYQAADLSFALEKRPSAGFQVTVTSQATPLFSGSLADFIKWAEKYTGLDNTVGKVVQFKYDGGTKPGSVRTIKVDKVEKNPEGTVTISGIDLECPDLTSNAYRSYTSDKIDGTIKQLN